MENIFGAKIPSSTAISSEPTVTIRVTPDFRSRYAHNLANESEWAAIPVSHWMDAFHDGYAPKFNPHTTSRALAHFLPLNILSRYFI